MCAHLKNSSLPFCMASGNLRIQRKAQGLCPTCGEISDREEYYECSACAERHRRNRQSRIKNGICVRCGKPNSNGKSVCDECTAKRKEESKKYRTQRAELGMCIQCGARKTAPGKKRCEFCLANQAEFSTRKFENLSEEEKNSVRKKRNSQEKIRKEKARESGLCVKCHKRKPSRGHSTCTECRVAYRKASKKWRENNKKYPTYEECIEQGICTTCRTNKATHKKLCEICYNKNMENIKKANAAPRKTEHFWVQDNRAIFFCKINGTGDFE